MQTLSRIVRFWVKSVIFGKNVAFVALINLWYGAIADFGADASYGILVKVARYSFSESIPPKFEHKLRRQKQSFGKLPSQLY